MAIDLGDSADVASLIDLTVTQPDLPAVAFASVNLDHIHHFGKDGPSRRQAMVDTPGLEWKVLLDGAPVAAAVRVRLRESWPLLPGSDLLPDILEQAAANGYTVGFLGGSAAMHTKLRAALADWLPSLVVSGYWSPSRAELEDKDRAHRLAREVRAASTDILVVGLGKPRQETWIQDYGVESGARVLLAFGAAADFLTGTSQRAPQWMRRLGLEWLHRLLKEPSRLAHRYLVLGPRAAVKLVRFGPRPIEPHSEEIQIGR